MKKAKIISIIASIAFILTLIFDLTLVAKRSILSYNFESLLWWAFLVLMAVLLVLNKRSIVFPIISGINVLRTLYVTRSFWANYPYYSVLDKLWTICNILSAIALFILFLIDSITTVDSKTISVLWFIPGAILAARYLPLWLTHYYSSVETNYVILIGIDQGSHLFAFLLACLWLKTSIQKQEKIPISSSDNCVKESVSMLGGADKLLQYYKLLDSGIITQDEFNEKKKQVLGL